MTQLFFRCPGFFDHAWNWDAVNGDAQWLCFCAVYEFEPTWEYHHPKSDRWGCHCHLDSHGRDVISVRFCGGIITPSYGSLEEEANGNKLNVPLLLLLKKILRSKKKSFFFKDNMSFKPIEQYLHELTAELNSQPNVSPSYKYRCEYSGCESSFKRLEHRRRHYLRHEGTKNHICPICSRAFSRSDNMHQHMRIHPPSDLAEIPKIIRVLRNPIDPIDEDLVIVLPREEPWAFSLPLIFFEFLFSWNYPINIERWDTKNPRWLPGRK